VLDANPAVDTSVNIKGRTMTSNEDRRTGNAHERSEFADGQRRKVQTAARFVLMPNGVVDVVPLRLTVKDVHEVVGEALLGRDGLATLADGRAFLDALLGTFQGSYLWATEPFEMELEEALQT
jgi:hypothetical protein